MCHLFWYYRGGWPPFSSFLPRPSFKRNPFDHLSHSELQNQKCNSNRISRDLNTQNCKTLLCRESSLLLLLIFNKEVRETTNQPRSRSSRIFMMEKSCPSNQSDLHHQTLRQVNKTSHKISKPMIRRTPPPPFDHSQQQEELQNQQNQQQNQPPVYNINKSDFREVVQKLTGSPAHDRFSNPSQPLSKPQTSRLQRIRPPPLAHLTTTRPSSSLNNAIPLPPTFNPNSNANFNNNGIGNGRSISPLSPLPPFPTVHAAAESPISAYMKYLRGSISTNDSDPKPFGALSPRWSNTNDYIMPNSPLAFGSPRSPCLPSNLPSPTAAQLGFPHPL